MLCGSFKAVCKRCNIPKKRKKFFSILFTICSLSCLLSGFLMCVCVCMCLELCIGIYIYSIVEVCVGHSSEWGEGRSTLRSQQREREECRQLVCVCQCNTESLQYWTTHTHTHAHTNTHTPGDERTIYLDQQSVCSVQWQAAGSSLADISTTWTKTPYGKCVARKIHAINYTQNVKGNISNKIQSYQIESKLAWYGCRSVTDQWPAQRLTN